MKLQHLFTIAIMALAPLSCAEEEKTISLFDGKTLDGWKSVGGNGQFKVEDGCIVGFGENIGGNTFLRTEKVYGDFELTYEFKFDDRSGNSGLMFRALQKPSEDGNGKVYGYQCEGDNKDRSWSAGLMMNSEEAGFSQIRKTKSKALHLLLKERSSSSGTSGIPSSFAAKAITSKRGSTEKNASTTPITMPSTILAKVSLGSKFIKVHPATSAGVI